MKCATARPIDAALTIAETGHLVFATLHTNSAVRVDQPHRGRVPGGPAATQIYSQLAFVLEGVVDAAAAPAGRAARAASMVAEVLVCTPAIRAVIREGKTHQIYSLMQAGTEVRHADDEPVARAARESTRDLVRGRARRSPDAKELDGMLGRSGGPMAGSSSYCRRYPVGARLQPLPVLVHVEEVIASC